MTRVGIVGATGAVGREMLSILAERSFPATSLRGFASARSAGSKIETRGLELVVEEVRPEVFDELDLALFSAGAGVSRELIPAATARGCTVVDNSSAFRGDPAVPLVVPEVNAEALADASHLVANPNCSTIVNAVALAPLHRAFGLTRMIVSTYQAASGAGQAGQDELLAGARACLEDVAEPAPAVFGEPLAFNAIPEIGEIGADGVTSEERKMTTESRRLFDRPDLEVACTCVRVPVLRAHALATTAFFEAEVDLTAARAALEAAPGVRLVTRPTPREAAGGDEVLVGRLRSLPFDRRGLVFFAVGDQLRKGAALNAIQIAEALLGDHGETSAHASRSD